MAGVSVVSSLSAWSSSASLGDRRGLRAPSSAACVSRGVLPVRCGALEKEELLKGVDKDNRNAVVRALEQAERAVDRWVITHTDFLTPPALADARRAVNRLGGVACVATGGYPEAERCRLTVGRDDMLFDVTDGIGHSEGVAAVSVAGRFEFDRASHRDFLGAILGTGIDRSKVGDILTQEETGAHIIVAPELVNYIESALNQVRSISVITTQIPLSQLKWRPAEVDTFRSVEASTRVDAVASAGFRISRSKLSEMISSGDLKVNWKRISKGSYVLQKGDVVSVAGLGRIQVGEVSPTKKDRFAIELVRFL
eukprot:jgi/Chlat1/5079/Chrsp33S00383